MYIICTSFQIEYNASTLSLNVYRFDAFFVPDKQYQSIEDSATTVSITAASCLVISSNKIVFCFKHFVICDYISYSHIIVHLCMPYILFTMVRMPSLKPYLKYDDN